MNANLAQEEDQHVSFMKTDLLNLEGIEKPRIYETEVGEDKCQGYNADKGINASVIGGGRCTAVRESYCHGRV
jgi:hypothetical protein